MPHVLVAGRIHEAGLTLLRDADGITYDLVDEVSTDAYAPLVANADAVLIRTQPMAASVIAEAKRLKLVSRHGVGYDAIDLDALTARGIPLAVCGDVNSLSVAEHTLALLLAAAKRMVACDASTRRGNWNARESYDGFEVSGRTLLLLGFGRIGRHVARMAGAFGMRILVFDPHLPGATIRDHGATPVSDLGIALAEADVVSVHMPRSGDEALIGEAQLAAMKPTAIVINTSRGGIVDEQALCAALSSGRLGGAGLDVLASEPPSADDPLLTCERVVLSPHVAGLTREAAARMSAEAVTNILDFFADRLDPSLVVNAAALERFSTVAASRSRSVRGTA
jgi:D-3-phosphoglycerate dehydrogenase / 2-oxoglutarate reductase